MFVKNSRAEVDFNILFRQFHQYCAVPDPVGIQKVCEPRLAETVNQAVERIHFHGLDVEMANLTVESKIKVLKVEVHHGLHVDRAKNNLKFTVSKSSLFGAPASYYIPAEQDNRTCLDGLDNNRKPYLVAVTAVMESPMKLYV